jgi:ribosome-associated translation inhibitor RaiA
MRLSIHHHHRVAIPPDLPAFIQKHLTRPLVRVFDSPAAELEIHLGDERPSKGGVDQACRLSFRMPGARTIHVESLQDDLKKALLDAGDRLRRHVRKQLSKMRSPSRKPMHRPLGRSWRERSTRRGATPDGGPAGL